MEEYYNPTLKEFINAVLDGETLYYKIGDYPYNQPIENPEYGIIDIKVPHTISCKKQAIKDELKLKDKDITEDDVDYFYFPELTVIYLKNN